MDKMLSVILLSYYSSDRLQDVYQNLNDELTKSNIPYELIIIDDGSKDDSYEIALSLEKEHEKVRAFQLSKNYTSNYAIFAGLSLSKGACVTAIPDDDQQPIDTIIKMYRLWEGGEKVIIPHRKNRDDGTLNDLFSSTYYKFMNKFSEIQFPKGGADLFFVDREVVDIINAFIHPKNTAIVPEILRLGFNPYFYPYERPKSKFKSRWTFKKKLKLFLDTFISSSAFPIKFITYLGVFFSLLSFILILFYFYIKIFGNEQFWGVTVPGWTSTILFIAFFSGLILLSLGIIAEYIWRIHEEVKDRPGYIIKNKEK